MKKTKIEYAERVSVDRKDGRQMNEKTIFAKRLKQARENKGLSQNALAKQAGTTSQMISTYEKATQGSRRGGPTIDTAAAIAKVLNVSLDWLVGIDDVTPTIASAAKDAEELAGLDGVKLTVYLDTGNGESCPALVFTDKCKLTPFMRELQSAQAIKTLEHGEEIYTAWRQKKMDDLAEAEGK